MIFEIFFQQLQNSGWTKGKLCSNSS